MRSALRSWVTYAVTSAAFCLILFYVAGSPLRQSIVLALLFAWFSTALTNASPKPSARFSPYWVRATPNWFQILTDYKLLNGQEEWVALQDNLGSLPEVANSEAAKGFLYSVVQHSSDGQQKLIYLDTRHAFVSEIDFRDYLKPFAMEHDRWPKPFEHVADVGVFIKWGVDGGYNLGIRVQAKWWENMKSLCPAVLKEDHDHFCGCVNLTLAILPYKEFGMYWTPTNWNASDYGEKIWDEIYEARKKHEWREKQDPDSDFSRYEPKTISHKYFDVLHDSI